MEGENKKLSQESQPEAGAHSLVDLRYLQDLAGAVKKLREQMKKEYEAQTFEEWGRVLLEYEKASLDSGERAVFLGNIARAVIESEKQLGAEAGKEVSGRYSAYDRKTRAEQGKVDRGYLLAKTKDISSMEENLLEKLRQRMISRAGPVGKSDKRYYNEQGEPNWPEFEKRAQEVEAIRKSVEDLENLLLEESTK